MNLSSFTHPTPLGLPSAPGPSACLMHPTWAGDLFHDSCYFMAETNTTLKINFLPIKKQI